MLTDFFEAVVEVLVIVGIFAGPALIWHRLVTGSWNFIDPDLRD
jgi:hypothetical protein